MIGQDGVTGNLNRKNRGQLFYAADQPLLAAVEVLTRDFVKAT